MIEKVKKTTTSETSKLKKIPVRRPKTIEKQDIQEAKSATSSKLVAPIETKRAEYCKTECSCKKISFRLVMLLVLILIANLTVGIWIALKISNLQQWTTIEAWGEQNHERLEAIYATPEYQKYFKGQIDSLEQQIKIMNPKAG